VEHRSFTSRRLADFTFDIDGEAFTAIGTAPAGPLLDVAAAHDDERIAMMMAFLDGVLVPESAERFAARLRSTDNPIDAQTLGEVVEYLVEVYSRRPTQPGEPSPNGDSTTGTSLTVAAPRKASTRRN